MMQALGEEILHYGIKERSGRYPWGSGENPYQRLGGGSIRARVKELEEQGNSKSEIARMLQVSTNELRSMISLEAEEEKRNNYYQTLELKDNGYKNMAIAAKLGISEGTVRNYLKENADKNLGRISGIADQIRDQVNKKKYVDVGEGAELSLNCSEETKNAAIMKLQNEGYVYHKFRIDQLGTHHKTTVVVLCKPGTEYSYILNNLDKVHEIDEDGRIMKADGTVKIGAVPFRSVDRSRIMVRYGEEGGSDRDGVIELRRGVDDISLGKANYAQVRIAVDDKMYMKGMAIYNDGKDMPPGIDIIYNSNKAKGSSDEKVFKELKKTDGKLDDNPFGATIKGIYDNERPDDKKELKLTQREYIDKDGKTQMSCINVVNEEGTWDGWSRTLSSQFLSKQSEPLARRQLNENYHKSVEDLNKIMKITEPTVQKKMLDEFAENCDAAASELKAAALPRQRNCVILPVPNLKDNEVYAPQYNNGEHVVLVRHPHAGPFESPELVVNNNNRQGKSIVGQSTDAIGINLNVAKQMSGADFDGDSVTVIPSDNVKIRTKAPLEGLKNFDPNIYALPDDKDSNGDYVYPTIKNSTKQQEMGKVSNLITDMTIIGATDDEITRAVKHSMVVIDSEKHRLDYKRSFKENGIAQLKEKYQGRANAGAATIISRAGSDAYVNERREYTKVDPKTGEKIYTETGRTYSLDKKVVDPDTGEITYVPTGKEKVAQDKISKMASVKDANLLTSNGKGGYGMERIYANYANQMKALANQARKERLAVRDREYNPSAAETFADEVKSLEAKLLIAQKNAPRERQAQMFANSKVRAQLSDHPEWKSDNDKLRKIKGQALASARATVGAHSVPITFTDREWLAIQSGAVRKSKLEKIIDKADKEDVRKRSMPSDERSISSSKVAAIKAMHAGGMTQAEIADAFGISASYVSKLIHAA